jgi:hypothetical protein
VRHETGGETLIGKPPNNIAITMAAKSKTRRMKIIKCARQELRARLVGLL